jgi:hypothetical protein
MLEYELDSTIVTKIINTQTFEVLSLHTDLMHISSFFTRIFIMRNAKERSLAIIAFFYEIVAASI